MARRPEEDDILLHSYTKADAKKLRDKYKYLEGQPYVKDGDRTGTIVHVCICPYDQLNKHLFLTFYKTSKCVNKSLENYYAPYYDVALIIESPNDQPILLELSDYLEENDSDEYN